MKKNIILATITLIVVALASLYFYNKNAEAKKKLIATQPYSIDTLRASLDIKKVNIDEACANPSALSSSVIDMSNPDVKEKFTFLCEDQTLSKAIEENFANNSDYTYFLNCAKAHTETMQEITRDLKEHYPEDYKELNFNKENQEAILLKYLKHPKSSYLMAQCESKMEALYWRSVISSGKVEDLKFCLQVTEDCIAGKSKPEECPANFKTYHEECTKKLGALKH